ncbi:MAG: acyl-CoA dehydrogenase [Frankiales bacterium]|nr:acyl-CoA dehydrogenase [Frankiales bacterium]
MDFALTEPQLRLVTSTRELARRYLKPRAADWDRDDRTPLVHLPVLAQAGLLGLTLPEQYGGGGGSVLDLILTLQEVAKVCRPSALIMCSQTGLGAKTVLQHGSADLRAQWLPSFCTGAKIVAWAMSEPDAGTDLAAIRTQTRPDGAGYRLSGEKTWISLAMDADVFIVITRFGAIPGLKGLGAVLVERNQPGVRIGKKISMMGMRGTGMAGVNFHECAVPNENVLLGPGDFKQLLHIMSDARVSGNPPLSLGIAEAALEAMKQYAASREVSGAKLAHHQGIRWRIADLTVKFEAAKMLVYRAAANAGAGTPSIADAATAKLAANDAAVVIADAAVQMCGAAGYSADLPFERLARDARGLCIGDGATDVMRNLLANEVLGRASA